MPRLGDGLMCGKRGGKKGTTDLPNSRLNALTASLALVSLAEERSQTSSTMPQSSNVVAVSKPRSGKYEVDTIDELGSNLSS